MSGKNRFSKPVAFNHTMVEDKMILAHVEGRNFSGYVKQLIMEDIRKGKAAAAQNRPSQAVGEGGEKIISSGQGGIKIVIGG
jgi:hypothetical protein